LKERLDVAARVSSGTRGSVRDRVCSIIFFIEFQEHDCKGVKLTTNGRLSAHEIGRHFVLALGCASILHVTAVRLLRDL